MQFASALSVTSLYAALLGLMFIPFTMRVGFYRNKTGIHIGDGGDPALLKRIRGQANFIETVPLALILLMLMELGGASPTWMHSLGAALTIGRLSHYLQLTDVVSPILFRVGGMLATLLVYIISTCWLLFNVAAI